MSVFQLRRLGMLMEPEPGNPREVEGVLNPAAARGPDGELYLFPRMVAKGNYSRIGIARVRFNASGDPAGVERLVEHRTGGNFVPLAHGDSVAGCAGMMGAMLSITGIFGMAAYSASKRLKEFGIRVALGAQRKEVLQAALGHAFKLLAIGSEVGLVLGLLATKVLAFIVYQATPRDPLVLAGVVVAMAALGLLATWIPAQRALSVNPLTLLRED
jgi:hypothetical protein